VERDKNGGFKNLPAEWAAKINFSISENSEHNEIRSDPVEEFES
jgi:hypothetical protein